MSGISPVGTARGATTTTGLGGLIRAGRLGAGDGDRRVVEGRRKSGPNINPITSPTSNIPNGTNNALRVNSQLPNIDQSTILTTRASTAKPAPENNHSLFFE